MNRLAYFPNRPLPTLPPRAGKGRGGAASTRGVENVRAMKGQ